MQYALRPYATVGVALIGASVVAVSPLVAPPPNVQTRSVKLVDAWTELVADSTANWQHIVSGADSQAISEVFSQLTTNPTGVIGALTNLDPAVASNLGSIHVELPPALELGLAQLGAEGAAFDAINGVVAQLESDPANAFSILYEGTATVLNAYLNGEDNVSLLDGTVTIPALNGILAPLQDADVHLNLANLIDALGLGDLNVGGLLGSLPNINTLGELLNALGLDDTSLGSLLTDPTLNSLLGDLGLGNLGLGSLSLTNILTGLGLDTNLNSLTLDQVLTAFGIDPTVNLGLSTLLTDLGFGNLLSEGVGTALASLPGDPLAALLSASEATLNTVTIGELLGGQSIDTSVSNILTDLGVHLTGSDLTIGGILTGLGVPGSTGDLTLGGLLGDLGVGNTGIGGLLDQLNLGSLLADLNLANLPLDLSNLGDLSNLTLGGLLGDLGQAGVVNIGIDGLGGFDTLLADVVPQQILAALGM